MRKAHAILTVLHATVGSSRMPFRYPLACIIFSAADWLYHQYMRAHFNN